MTKHTVTIEYPDLKFTDEYVFNQGRDAYHKNSNNPYFKWQEEKRADWIRGFLYEQRLTIRSKTNIHREGALDTI